MQVSRSMKVREYDYQVLTNLGRKTNRTISGTFSFILREWLDENADKYDFDEDAIKRMSKKSPK